MDYQVWTKDEYDDKWSKADCGDLGAAKRKILEASKSGQTVMLTQELPFELQLKIGEPGAEVRKPKMPKTPLAGDGAKDGGQDEVNPDKPE